MKQSDLDVEISDEDNIYDSLDELATIKGVNSKSVKFIGKKKEKFIEFKGKETKKSLFIF